MAVSIVGTPTIGESASATSLACNVPAGVTAGELLVAHVTHSKATAVPAQTGWTTGLSLASAASQAVFYRWATASEPASYTFSVNAGGADRCTATIMRLSGLDSTTPLDVTPVGATATGTSLTHPGVTTVTGDALILWSASRANASNTTTINGPAEVTKLLESTGTGRRHVLFSEARPSAGATGSRLFSPTDTNSLGMGVIGAAFRPTATVTPPASTTVTPNSVATGAAIGAPTVTNGSVPAPAGSLVHIWTGDPDGTRVPVKVRTSGAASVRLKLGTNSSVTVGVVYTAAQAPDSAQYTTFQVTGLSPDTAYWFQAEVDGVLASQVGSFRTDNPGVARSFRVGFGSCLTSGNTTSTAFDNMLANAPELFLHLGDFHYGNLTSTSVATQRAAYETQITGNTGLANALRIPTVYQPSDHDSGGNDWTGGPGVQTPAWNTAIRQIMPVKDTLPSTGGVYRSVHRGRVKFILTDGRSFKSPAANADDASKTMFGFTQESWIASELADANYPVKILCLDVPWVYPTTAGDDKWGGYKAAAGRLVDAITAANAKVFVIHGDAHSLCADDGTSVNNTGGLPVAGAAPFGNSTSIKGGPYSQGTWPLSGATGGQAQQHGLLDITDTGSAITVRFSGRDSANTERVTLSKTYSTAAAPAATTVTPTAIASWAALGAPTLAGAAPATVTVAPDAIASRLSLAFPVVTALARASDITVTPSSVPPEAHVGTPDLLLQVWRFAPPNVIRTVPMFGSLRAQLMFGLTVYRKAGEWFEDESPSSDELSGADRIYWGGCVHDLSRAQADELTAAGYGDRITITVED